MSEVNAVRLDMVHILVHTTYLASQPESLMRSVIPILVVSSHSPILVVSSHSVDYREMSTETKSCLEVAAVVCREVSMGSPELYAAP